MSPSLATDVGCLVRVIRGDENEDPVVKMATDMDTNFKLTSRTNINGMAADCVSTYPVGNKSSWSLN